MPSLGAIFIVSGVAVGTGVDVASGVEVSINVGVEVGAVVAVAGEGVAVLWQAASKIAETRNGIIFFITGY
jgi:hypothetical protein